MLPCIETYQKVDLRTITLGVPPQEVNIIQWRSWWAWPQGIMWENDFQIISFEKSPSHVCWWWYSRWFWLQSLCKSFLKFPPPPMFAWKNLWLHRIFGAYSVSKSWTKYFYKITFKYLCHRLHGMVGGQVLKPHKFCLTSTKVFSSIKLLQTKLFGIETRKDKRTKSFASYLSV